MPVGMPGSGKKLPPAKKLPSAAVLTSGDLTANEMVELEKFTAAAGLEKEFGQSKADYIKAVKGLKEWEKKNPGKTVLTSGGEGGTKTSWTKEQLDAKQELQTQMNVALESMKKGGATSAGGGGLLNDIAGTVLAPVQEIVAPVVQAAQSVVAPVATAAQQVVGSVYENVVKPHVEAAQSIAQNVINPVAGTVLSAVQPVAQLAASNIQSTLGPQAEKLGTLLGDAAEGVLGGTQALVSNIGNTITTAVADTGSYLETAFGGMGLDLGGGGGGGGTGVTPPPGVDTEYLFGSRDKFRRLFRSGRGGTLLTGGKGLGALGQDTKQLLGSSSILGG